MALFVAATSDLDRDGDRLDVATLRLDHFASNPIMLAQHDRHTPIGTWEVYLEDGRLMAEPRFASTATAQEYAALVDEEVIRAVSVGFAPDPETTTKNEHGGFDFVGAELCEISLVSVPANPRAIRAKSATDPLIRKENAMTVKKPAAITKTKSEEAPPSETKELDPEALEARLVALEERLAALEAASEPEEKAEGDEEETDEPDDELEEKAFDLLASFI